ncbi:MAG: ribonuclease III [bacterium ADurb.Bin478]|nr:MAG: ribonuclease III [bacterium ADurb.Bin478]
MQEWLQARKMALPVYRVLATHGAAHQQTFEVVCEVAALARNWQATSLDNLCFSVDEVVLMRSDLRAEGAVYTPLRRVRLATAV